MKDYKKFFKGKKITVMGLGLLGGVGDIRFLAECGAELIVTDLKTEAEAEKSLKILKKFKNIRYTLGEHKLSDFENRDLIIKAPSTPLDSPYIEHARNQNIPVAMWAALFSEFAREAGATVIGVTGTRGKTTVATLVAEILRAAGKKVIFGGNIKGTSILSNLPKLNAKTFVVLELDSWKLQGFGGLKISPHVSVFTTFFEDHLNYYPDMSTYFSDKESIYKFQTAKDALVVGAQVLPIIKKWSNLPKSKLIVAKKKLPSGWTLEIPGVHNLYNAALALEVSRLVGVSDSVAKKVFKDFKGVPGRFEFVRMVRKVKYYNDTTATTPEGVIAGLKTLPKKKNIILIAGGADKGVNMDLFVTQIPKYTKAVVLLSGTGTDRIKNKIKARAEVSTMKDAVREASKLAASGDVVLLAPGFASKGLFKNEYDRGDQFVKLVRALK